MFFKILMPLVNLRVDFFGGMLFGWVLLLNVKTFLMHIIACQVWGFQFHPLN